MMLSGSCLIIWRMWAHRQGLSSTVKRLNGYGDPGYFHLKMLNGLAILPFQTGGKFGGLFGLATP